jgi:hypothetical protein
MQNLLGYGGESYVKDGVIKHYVGSARLSWVDCDDVAAVAAVCLLDPDRHAGMGRFAGTTTLWIFLGGHGSQLCLRVS